MIKSNTVDEKPGDVNIALAALAHEISILRGTARQVGIVFSPVMRSSDRANEEAGDIDASTEIGKQILYVTRQVRNVTNEIQGYLEDCQLAGVYQK